VLRKLLLLDNKESSIAVKIQSVCPVQLLQLIKRCLSTNPQKRPSFTELDRSFSVEIKIQVEDDVESLFESNSSLLLDLKDINISYSLHRKSGQVTYLGNFKGKEVLVFQYNSEMSGAHLEEFKNEFQIMYSITSPHIVKFFGYAVYPDKSFCVLTEYCKRGSLQDIMKENLNITWNQAINILSGIAQGLDFLHSHRPQIIHRDLRPSSVFIDENWVPKIGKFGLSKFTQEAHNNLQTLATISFSYAYSAPEILDQKLSPESDVYSFAMVAVDLVNRVATGQWKALFSEFPSLRFDFQILMNVAKKHTRPTIASSCPTFLADLIQKCWQHKPEERPKAGECYKILDEHRNTN